MPLIDQELLNTQGTTHTHTHTAIHTSAHTHTHIQSIGYTKTEVLIKWGNFFLDKNGKIRPDGRMSELCSELKQNIRLCIFNQ